MRKALEYLRGNVSQFVLVAMISLAASGGLFLTYSPFELTKVTVHSCSNCGLIRVVALHKSWWLVERPRSQEIDRRISLAKMQMQDPSRMYIFLQREASRELKSSGLSVVDCEAFLAANRGVTIEELREQDLVLEGVESVVDVEETIRKLCDHVWTDALVSHDEVSLFGKKTSVRKKRDVNSNFWKIFRIRREIAVKAFLLGIPKERVNWVLRFCSFNSEGQIATSLSQFNNLISGNCYYDLGPIWNLSDEQYLFLLRSAHSNRPHKCSPHCSEKNIIEARRILREWIAGLDGK